MAGPHRVFPGRLSVSRTFGDIEAKDPRLLGNEKVVIADPDISHFPVTSECDFVILGCDGIFDKLDDKAVVHLAWQSNSTQLNFPGNAVDAIMKSAAMRHSADNLSVLLIAFDSFPSHLVECCQDLTKFCHETLDLSAIDLLLPPGL